MQLNYIKFLKIKREKNKINLKYFDENWKKKFKLIHYEMYDIVTRRITINYFHNRVV